MNDKSLGYLIILVSVAVMVSYFVWAFAPVLGPMFAWLAPYADWAFKLPVFAAAYMVLFIVLWIGYTMATTPPPISLDNPLDLDDKGSESEEKSSDS
jgi:hypothetical protein